MTVKPPEFTESESITLPQPSWAENLLRYQPSLLDHLHELLDGVAAYLPRVVAEALLDRPTTAILTQALEGTAMFADIDGFTAMSERFSQQASREGAEELTELVNRFLDILITTTQRYGGDLQKFGGDAGMLFFTGEAHALHAIGAALDVQRAMKAQLGQVETSLGCFPLEIAIGLGSGRLVGAGLGTESGREWVLSGPPLKAMGRAQQAAPTGGVVMDAETYALCSDVAVCEALPDSLYLVQALETAPEPHAPPPLVVLPATDPTDQLLWLLSRLNALTPYLPEELLARLTSAPDLEQMHLWSEHRRVTILMLSLSALPDYSIFGADPERLKRVLAEPNAMLGRVRQTIQRYDGIINKISTSPTGNYLMALFGAPKAHEDDPLRAVLAALELQEQADIPLRIGINSGFVFAGDVGTAERREYTVMGDEVNLAYRLMSGSTPGETLLGPNTADHPSVSQRVLGERLAPQHFKGKRDPIAPFLARRLRPLFTGVDTSVIPLVDREQELAQLQQALAALEEGTPQIVLLHGEAGIGKSRLAQELTKLALQAGSTVHLGVAPSYGGHLPYAAWEAPLLSLLGLENRPTTERAAVLEQTLAQYGLAPWTALLAPLIGAEMSPSPEVAALAPDLQQQQRIETLRELWEHTAQERPLVLILENAQWMAPPSLEIVDALLEHPPAAPLLLVITYRDLPAVTDRWAAPDRPERMEIALEPLSSRATRLLARRMAQGADLPREVERWLLKQGGQTPLYSIEALQGLIASGVLERHEDAWTLTQPLEKIPLPATLYELIQSRIDQLEPPSRHLLRAASVAGEQLTVQMLVAGYGEEPLPAVKGRLPRLTPLGLLYGDPAEETLVFRQPLTREVAYRGLAYRMQRHIHRRLTEYLAQQRERATSNWVTLLAYHAYEGQLWEIAMRANLDLGRQMQRSYLTQQAVQAFERALEAADAGDLPATDERFEMHHLLGETLTLLGEYDAALEHLGQARSLLPQIPGNPMDVARAADIAYHIASVLESQGKYKEAFTAIKQGLDLPNVTQILEGAQLYLIGTGLFYRQGDYEKSSAWAQRVIDLVNNHVETAPQKIKARALYLMAVINYRQGNLQRAVALGEESLAHYEKLQDLPGEVSARTNLLVIYLNQGAWNIAVTHGEKALAIAQRIHYKEGEARVAANLGEIYRYQGHLEEARLAYTSVLNISKELGMTFGEALMENNLAAVAIQEDQFSEAEQRLQRSETLFNTMGSESMLPEIYRHYGELALKRADPQTALVHGEKSLTLAKSQGNAQEIGRSQHLIAKIYLELQTYPAVNAALDAAIPLLEETKDLYGTAHARLTLAKLQLALGNQQAAHTILQSAAEQFKALDARRELAHIRALREGESTQVM